MLTIVCENWCQSVLPACLLSNVDRLDREKVTAETVGGQKMVVASKMSLSHFSGPALDQQSSSTDFDIMSTFEVSPNRVEISRKSIYRHLRVRPAGMNTPIDFCR
ncbi:hypothetical protein ElyMa_005275100 [Elysia marginata]|uniref:Uncharacterized protein n=1 Tax=Elysia marginata TaxID=1093978 RepID=A0AAV4JYT5_9GAST|nr:hypothetical protein ElyMa_005275100 [Elysia marginata]